MSKTKFIEIVKNLRNEVPVNVRTKNYNWEISFTTRQQYSALVYRVSTKNNKELIKFYDNSADFLNKVMRLAENQTLEVLENQIIEK